MRSAVARFTDPLTAWLPDLSRVPVQRQVTIGVVASVLLHALGFVVMAVLAGVMPKSAEVVPPKPPEQLELQIVEPEQPKIVAAPVPEEKPFIDSRGLAESKPAEKPVFESDKDMTEASEKAAKGDLELPSQEGRGRIDNVFETKKAEVGKVEEPPAPVAPPPVVPEPEQATPRQEKSTPVQPAATPPPKTRDRPDAAEIAKTTLERLREVERKREEEIALQARELPPLPPPVAKREPQQMAKLTTPAPELKPPAKPAYQPEREQSRVEGRITNRGKSAVSAVATPLGKYKAQVYNAVGSRWLYYVKSQMDVLAIGTARVSFVVTGEGRVRDIRVEGNTANASFAEVCERAIRDAEISQPPAGSLDQLRDGRLEYSISFTLYNFQQ